MIAVVLVVTVVVLIAGVIGVFVFGTADQLQAPAPTVSAEGEFEVEDEDFGEQTVRIRHSGGESVSVEELEIIVRASGPDVDTEARLVDLPGDGSSISLADSNIDGNDDLINQGFGSARIIVVDDSNTWSVGDTIQFQISTGDSAADFREGESPEADELEVVIVHAPSDAITYEETLDPELTTS